MHASLSINRWYFLPQNQGPLCSSPDLSLHQSRYATLHTAAVHCCAVRVNMAFLKVCKALKLQLLSQYMKLIFVF